MSNTLIAFFIAAGTAAFAYSKFGRRVGYSNAQSIWLFVGAIFLFVFVCMLLLLGYIIHLH